MVRLLPCHRLSEWTASALWSLNVAKLYLPHPAFVFQLFPALVSHKHVKVWKDDEGKSFWVAAGEVAILKTTGTCYLYLY